MIEHFRDDFSYAPTTPNGWLQHRLEEDALGTAKDLVGFIARYLRERIEAIYAEAEPLAVPVIKANDVEWWCRKATRLYAQKLQEDHKRRMVASQVLSSKDNKRAE